MPRVVLPFLLAVATCALCRGAVREFDVLTADTMRFWTGGSISGARPYQGGNSYAIPCRGSLAAIEAITPIELPGIPASVGVWVYNPGQRVGLSVYVMGSEGERDGYTLRSVNGTGWQYLELPLTAAYHTYSYSCFDPVDGQPTPPVFLETVNISVGGGYAGTIYVGRINVLTDVSAGPDVSLALRTTRTTNLFSPGEAISFHPQVHNFGDTARAVALNYRVTDFAGTVVQEGTTTITVSAGETQTSTLEITTLPGGHYRLSCDAAVDGSTVGQEDLPFAIFQPQTKSAFNDDSPFGLNRGWSSPYEPIDAIGVDWIRPGAVFTWSTIEPSKGDFHWENTDQYLAEMDQHHLRVLGWLIDLPAWAAQAGSPLPSNLADWSDYVYQLVSRYRGRILAWELENEPNNHPDDWTPARYAAYLQATYPAMKQADPAAKLVGIAACRIDLGYIEQVFQAGGFDYMDAVSIHPYCDPQSTEATYFEAQLQALADLIDRYGGGKEIWLTEIGWETGTDTRAVDQTTQAHYIARMYIQALAAKYVTRVFYFYYADVTPCTTQYEDNWGLMTYGDLPKPACVAYNTLSNDLRGTRLINKLTLGSNQYGYTFASPDREITAIWSTPGTQSVTLIVGTGPLTLHDLMGNDIPATRNGSQLFLTLGESPIFIRRTPGGKPITMAGTLVNVVPYNQAGYNTFNANNPSSKTFWTTTSGGSDLKWELVTGQSWAGPGITNVLRSEAMEDCPELMTTITGLDPAKTYDLYVVYRSTRSYMGIRAGLQKSSLVAYTMDNGVMVSDVGTYQAKVGQVHGVAQASVYVDDYNPSGNDQAGFFYGLDYTIPPVRLQGTVALDGFVGDNTTVGVRFDLVPVGGGDADTRFINLAANGGFELDNVTPGTYDIWVKAYASLRTVLDNVSITTDPTILPSPIVLRGDDINGDGQVTFEDFAILQNTYGQTGPSAGPDALTGAARGCGILGLVLLTGLGLAINKGKMR